MSETTYDAAAQGVSDPYDDESEGRVFTVGGGDWDDIVDAVDGARRVFYDDGEVAIAVRSHGETFELESDGRVMRGQFERSRGRVRLTLGGAVYDVEIEPEVAVVAGSAAGGAGSGSAIIGNATGVIAISLSATATIA